MTTWIELESLFHKKVIYNLGSLFHFYTQIYNKCHEYQENFTIDN